MRSPFLSVVVTLARHRQTLADQLVLGVVTGGLLGPGLLIEGRESNRIYFAKADGVFSSVPDRGELRLEETEPGETRVTCEVWCRGMGLRRASFAVLAAASLATFAAFGFDWLMTVSLPFAAIVALTLDLLGGVRDRRRLRRQITAFLKNTTYLKSL
jgi:hypothetical protein